MKNVEEGFEEFQKQIRQENCIAKEYWIKSQCEEIDVLKKKHESFNMYRKAKGITGMYKIIMGDKNDQIIFDKYENNISERIILKTFSKMVID